MRLLIAAVGRLKSGPERDLLGRYTDRANAAGRAVSLAPVEITEIAESQSKRPADRMAEEWERIGAAVSKGAKRIVLDARGRNLSSEDFAKKIAGFRDQGASTTAFVIGGADGLPDKARSEADLSLSFGAATFPHQIVRILLAEQIYRAITILSGHPYHRA
jgi:23S rRNA (pseudouridine1915-N3)-methyltransferase